jgi:hypothetical protein
MSSHESTEVKLSPTQCTELNAGAEPLRSLEDWIDECDMRGDLKTALKSAIRITATSGRLVVRFGAWAVSTIKKVCEEFPCTCMGALVGFLIGILFSSLPMVGPLLGALLTPFIVTATILAGFATDVYVKTVGDALRRLCPSSMLIA